MLANGFPSGKKKAGSPTSTVYFLTDNLINFTRASMLLLLLRHIQNAALVSVCPVCREPA